MHQACRDNIASFQERFKNIEQETRERAFAVWREEINKRLEAIDKEATAMLRREKPSYQSKGMVSCRVVSSAGLIKFRIHRLYDPQKKSTLYPFQYVLGKRHTVTTELKEKAILVATHLPYERTSKLLEKLLGVGLGKMRIWDSVQHSGKAIRREIDRRRKKILNDGDDRFVSVSEPEQLRGKPVVVEADGTFIHVRQRVRQDLLTEEVREDQLEHHRLAEVKVGVMFRGVIQRSRTRKETLCPTVYAEIARVRDFGERWYAKCRSYGYTPRQQTTFLSDGSVGLRLLRDDHFPTATAVLDLYHLKRSLTNALPPEIVSVIVTKLCRGHTEEAFAELERIAASSPRVVRNSVNGVIRYLHNNRDALKYHRTALRGSGVIEKVVDNLVKRRFKRQGMSWSVEGANNLLAVRSAYFDYASKQKFRTLQLPLLTVPE